MNNTFIIRRVDDLGRIVIPKEIRKNMKIKDGESVEIYLDSDNIILKKYSPLGNIMEFYKSYVNSIYEAILENIMIVDLLRNDLGQISKTGSVKVDKLFEIEAHPTLFQMTSEISAELEDNVNLYRIVVD